MIAVIRFRWINRTFYIFGIIILSVIGACNKNITTWSKTFGGSEDDWGNSVQELPDGGFIIVGGTESYGAGNKDVLLIKTDVDGNKTWDKTFGGIEKDYGSSVQLTGDGGFIIVGRTESYGAGKIDVWLIKTDADGNKIWDKTFGGIEKDYGGSVQLTDDGGFIITGSTKSYGDGKTNVWLIKTDSDGNILWDKTFGDTQNNFYGYDVLQTTDGEFAIVGMVEFVDSSVNFLSGYYRDILLLRTDTNGDLLWNKNYVGKWWNSSGSVQRTTDGGFVVTGYKTVDVSDTGLTGYYDLWLIKTDADGNKVWDKTFGGAESDYGRSVRQTTDGGFVIAGYTKSDGDGKSDVWLIKTDIDGNKVWDKTFGGAESDYGRSVRQTNDGGFIIAGETASYGVGKSDVWLIKTNADGNVN